MTTASERSGAGERGALDHFLSVATGATTGGAIALATPFLLHWLFAVMNTGAAVSAIGRDYLGTYLLGMPLIFGFFAVDAAFRAKGDTRTPLYILVVTTVFGLVLDPILIRGLGPVPAFGIRGAAQLLEMEMESKELTEYTQVIIREADRLQTLVDRLLAPHRRPHMVGDVNIHEVCERVRSLIVSEFPRGIRVVRDYDTSIPEFRGDREQLIQAVLNIAHNAAQAMSDRITEGDAQLIFRTRIARQVTFGKQRYRLALELHVIDNGPGVPDSIKDRIFFPLITGREGGSGLGLTLAQTFVQQHHGLIECESVPGRTDFKILIPLP